MLWSNVTNIRKNKFLKTEQEPLCNKYHRFQPIHKKYEIPTTILETTFTVGIKSKDTT